MGLLIANKTMRKARSLFIHLSSIGCLLLFSIGAQAQTESLIWTVPQHPLYGFHVNPSVIHEHHTLSLPNTFSYQFGQQGLTTPLVDLNTFDLTRSLFSPLESAIGGHEGNLPFNRLFPLTTNNTRAQLLHRATSTISGAVLLSENRKDDGEYPSRNVLLRFMAYEFADYQISYGETFSEFASNPLFNGGAGAAFDALGQYNMEFSSGYGFSIGFGHELIPMKLNWGINLNVQVPSRLMEVATVPEQETVSLRYKGYEWSDGLWETTSSPVSGIGIGTDIGFTYIPNRRWKIGLAVTNLGVTSWRDVRNGSLESGAEIVLASPVHDEYGQWDSTGYAALLDTFNLASPFSYTDGDENRNWEERLNMTVSHEWEHFNFSATAMFSPSQVDDLVDNLYVAGLVGPKLNQERAVSWNPQLGVQYQDISSIDVLFAIRVQTPILLFHTSGAFPLRSSGVLGGSPGIFIGASFLIIPDKDIHRI